MNPGKLYENVNFVPSWYLERRHRRAVAQRMSLLLVALVAVMVMLVVGTWRNGQELRRYHAALTEQIQASQHQESELNKLRCERQALSAQVALNRKLALPIGMSPIVATLAAMTPDSIMLTEVQAMIKTESRTRVITPADQSPNGRAVTRAEPYKIVVIELDGVAPTDVEIANYVGRLAAANLFRNVKMLYSRVGQLDQAVTRQFKLTLEVPLDRTYRRILSPEIADVS